MIYIIIALFSISILYLVKNFIRKRMNVALVAVVVLIIAVFVLSFCVFFLRAIRPDFPKDEDLMLLLIDRNLFKITGIPELTMCAFQAIMSLFTISIGVTMLVLLHGFFAITKAVFRNIRNAQPNETQAKMKESKYPISYYMQVQILKQTCKMNC